MCFLYFEKRREGKKKKALLDLNPKICETLK